LYRCIRNCACNIGVLRCRRRATATRHGIGAAKSWAVQRPRPCACSIGIPRCKRRGAARQHGVGTAKSWGCSKTPPLSQEIGLHSPPNLHTAHTKAHAYQEAKKCDLGIVPHRENCPCKSPHPLCHKRLTANVLNNWRRMHEQHDSQCWSQSRDRPQKWRNDDEFVQSLSKQGRELGAKEIGAEDKGSVACLCK